MERGEDPLFVVRREVRHNPLAGTECLLMRIERKSALHAGCEVTGRTRSITQPLGPC